MTTPSVPSIPRTGSRRAGVTLSSGFLNDGFNDGAVELSLHTGETGASWTQHSASGTTATVTATTNRVRTAVINLNAIYYASGVPSSSDYTVTLPMFVASQPTSGSIGPIARVDTATETYYHFRMNLSGGSGWQLFKFVAGVATQLGSTVLEAITNSNTYVMELVVQGTTITGKVDGVTKVSVTDAAISAIGKAGLRGHSASVSDILGLHASSITGRVL